MLAVFTGNGKGKTTAALGQMLRAVGRGRRALMIQFIKGPWRSGEDEFISNLKSQISNLPFEIRKMGLGFVGILGDTLPREEHARAAEKALAMCKEEIGKDPAADGWHTIVLDEINVATSLGLIAPAAVLEVVKKARDEQVVILTGRGAPQEFIESADLVTEMREVQHPFQEGKLAKEGIEF